MYSEFYKAAKDIIGDSTPLKADCGLVCDKNCCKGNGETGMLLFPGEETAFKVVEKNGIRLCVCSGECDREKRPLSCMIFPLFPYMSRSGKITAAVDVRGMRICPLVDNEADIRFNRKFRCKIKRLGRFLVQDKQCRRFIWDISREIDKINMFLK